MTLCSSGNIRDIEIRGTRGVDFLDERFRV